jgi:hypothetical protein
MGTDKVAFAVELPEVTPVTCLVRKYVMRMRNQKLRNIRPSVAFLTGSDVSHVTGRGPVQR